MGFFLWHGRCHNHYVCIGGGNQAQPGTTLPSSRVPPSLMQQAANSSDAHSPAVGQLPHADALQNIPVFTETPHPASQGQQGSVQLEAPVSQLLQESKDTSTKAVSVGPGSPPIPRKLAEKIWRGEFIELHELLPSRLTTPEPTVLDLLSHKVERPAPKKTISTIQEWVTCFNTYIALIATHQPARVPDLLAYSSIIVRASSQYADLPWLNYDAHFRREVATRPGSPWSTIDSSIWTLHFSRATPIQKAEARADGQPQPAQRRFKPYTSQRYHPYNPPICLKWNRRNGCDLQDCSFRHICLLCKAPKHNQLSCPRNNTSQAYGKESNEKRPFRPYSVS